MGLRQSKVYRSNVNPLQKKINKSTLRIYRLFEVLLVIFPTATFKTLHNVNPTLLSTLLLLYSLYPLYPPAKSNCWIFSKSAWLFFLSLLSMLPTQSSPPHQLPSSVSFCQSCAHIPRVFSNAPFVQLYQTPFVNPTQAWCLSDMACTVPFAWMLYPGSSPSFPIETNINFSSQPNARITSLIKPYLPFLEFPVPLFYDPLVIHSSLCFITYQ